MTTLDTPLHVRFNGSSAELTLESLSLRRDSSDEAVRTKLARAYGRKPADFAQYVVVREENAVIVRPVAFYG